MLLRRQRKIVKKKILFVINSLGCGGAEKSLISMLSAFDFEKYEVHLQMFQPKGMFLNLLPKEVHILQNLPYLQFCGQSLKKQLRNPRFLAIKYRTSIGLHINQRTGKLHDAQCYWKCASAAFEQMQEPYDIAIAWGQGNPTHFVCEKVDAKKKIAFINADYEAVGHNKHFDYPFYKKYNYIVAVSEQLKKILRTVFADMSNKIVTIYDINNAELMWKLAELENPFEDKKDTIKVVTVGRLVKPKGYDLLTKACKYLKDRGLDFEWHVIGEGPERKNIENDIRKLGIEKHLYLEGAKENPYCYMANADIYVQTSKNEGYCLTLGEARILNVPVVSTNFDVVFNQLKNEENGLIVEMTGEAIAEGILRMVENKVLRTNIISNLQKEKKGNLEELFKFYNLIES